MILEKLDRYLARRSPVFVTGVGVLLTLVLGAIDYRTGWELSFALFYVLTVTLVSWYAGRNAGLLLAALSALVWFAANRLAGEPYASLLVPLWNALARLGLFGVAALTMARLSRTVAALNAALAREKELARVDSLTGVGNARAFYELAEREISRARRNGHPLGVAYLDVDGFKAINDDRGHSAGDQLLRHIAEVLVHTVRNMDIVARLGGDEFALLFPEAGPEATQIVVGKVHRVLDETMRREGYPVSFSIGAVTLQAPWLPVDQLVHYADTLMYAVKQSGKNAVKHEVAPGS